MIDLSAGWNAISFPANPIDTALDAVFTDEAIDRVVGWNPLSSTGPWSIASRVDGVWTTSANFAPLTDVVVRYGYWVHSMAFIKQSVDLEGPINRETGEKPHPVGIETIPGWNFVGVVDQDGDQTEDDFGETCCKTANLLTFLRPRTTCLASSEPTRGMRLLMATAWLDGDDEGENR